MRLTRPASCPVRKVAVGAVTRALRPAGDFDQPLLLQDEQRLAHGRPADAEALHQFLLRRQPAAHVELAGCDRFLDMVGHFMGAFATAEG